MNLAMVKQETIHATALVIGETGILLRGRSGAGKSSLAYEMIEWSRLQGRFGRLVSDDRVRLFATSARLLAMSHERIAGLIEVRGARIITVPYEKACRVSVVVDIVDRAERLPAPEDQVIELLGIKLYRLYMDRSTPMLARLAQIHETLLQTV